MITLKAVEKLFFEHVSSAILPRITNRSRNTILRSTLWLGIGKGPGNSASDRDRSRCCSKGEAAVWWQKRTSAWRKLIGRNDSRETSWEDKVQEKGNDVQELVEQEATARVRVLMPSSICVLSSLLFNWGAGQATESLSHLQQTPAILPSYPFSCLVGTSRNSELSAVLC